jgi:hypothetical protein
MAVLRAAQPTEATLLAQVQERASVAAFFHVCRRRFPPNPLGVGYTLDF